MTTQNYQFWLAELRRRLVDPDAEQCLIGGQRAIEMAYKGGIQAKKLARKLNNRYRIGWTPQEKGVKER